MFPGIAFPLRGKDNAPIFDANNVLVSIPQHAYDFMHTANLHDKLVTTLKTLHREYLSERDSLYNSVTNDDGQYDCDEDERAVAEMDAILDDAQAVIAEAEAHK